jgi:hypothetical protein
MGGPDEEFEDFLNRRKPVFRRPTGEMFEPPAELDRVVLRQAREAIKPPEPMRMFSAPRWSMPIALAATLVLAFTIMFRAGNPPARQTAKPELTVQNAAERADVPAAVAAPPPPELTASRNAAADVAQPALAAEAQAARSKTSGRMAGASSSRDTVPATVANPVKVGKLPVWRLDPKSWQAEIQRLRDAGDNARADEEAAEFKRQHSAYAVAPDR